MDTIEGALLCIRVYILWEGRDRYGYRKICRLDSPEETGGRIKRRRDKADDRGICVRADTGLSDGSDADGYLFSGDERQRTDHSDTGDA